MKKLESYEEEKEDKISSLPDDILVQILSLLPASIYSARTSVLSKRWTHLWSLVPVIHIYNESFTYPPKDGLSDFANQVLFNNNIKELRIGFNYGVKFPRLDYYLPLFNTWIASTIEGGCVESIRIAFANKRISRRETTCTSPHLRIPSSLFTCQSLVSLELKIPLESYEINVPEQGSCVLPNLKVLDIQFYVPATNTKNFEIMGKIFSIDTIFPVLERLSIAARLWSLEGHIKYICEKPLTIHICGPTLKELVIKFFEDPDYRCSGRGTKRRSYKIVVEAPFLESFTVVETSIWLRSSVEKMDGLSCSSSSSSIFKASGQFSSHYYLESGTSTINREVDDQFMLDRLRYPTPDVLVDDPSPPVFRNLIHLGLRFLNEEEWDKLGFLLSCSPNLEHLNIHLQNVRDPGVRSDTVFPSLVPECLALRMKKIALMFPRDTEIETKWIQYLLKEGRTLSIMKIKIGGYGGPMMYSCDYKKKILEFSKGYPDCVIVI